MLREIDNVGGDHYPCNLASYIAARKLGLPKPLVPRIIVTLERLM
jgi:hypothetical protein